MSNLIPGDEILSILERVERLHEEKRGIEDDIKEIYQEAKGNGYDTKVLRKLVKERGTDASELQEHEAMLEVYREAVNKAVMKRSRGTRACAHVENIEEFRSVRDSDAAVQKGTSERSQLAPAGDVSEESPAKEFLGDGNTGGDSAAVNGAATSGTGVTDRRDGQSNSNQVDAPPRGDLTADERVPLPPESSSVSSSHPVASESGIGDALSGSAPKILPDPVLTLKFVTAQDKGFEGTFEEWLVSIQPKSTSSSAEGPIQAEEGAQSQSVRTAGKGQKPSGGKLPPVARDPHRMGSFSVRDGSAENVRRQGKMNVPENGSTEINAENRQ